MPHCSIIQGADAGLAIPAAASRSKSAWRIPGFARQQAACITRRQQRAVSIPCCQQRLQLLWLWRLLAECNSTNVALAAFGQAKSHQLASTRVGRAVARGENPKHRAANRFRLLNSSTLSHQPPLGRTKNYKIDPTDDKKDQNPFEKKSSRNGPFLTGGIRLHKKCLNTPFLSSYFSSFVFSIWLRSDACLHITRYLCGIPLQGTFTYNNYYVADCCGAQEMLSRRSLLLLCIIG